MAEVLTIPTVTRRVYERPVIGHRGKDADTSTSYVEVTLPRVSILDNAPRLIADVDRRIAELESVNILQWRRRA